MTWNKIVGPFAITSRYRGVASALIYGLTLTVRFTSATGEEGNGLLQAAHGNDPMLSIAQQDGLPVSGQPPSPVRSIVCPRGQSCGLKSCRAARQAATPMPDCPSP